jgi:hypothetical protein
MASPNFGKYGAPPPKGSAPKNTSTSQDLSNWVDDFTASQKQLSAPAQNPNPPESIADSINAMPNSEKLSGTERWIYKTLPGVANSPVGKLLSSFAESPAGKILNILDYGAEGLERTFGVLAQYRDRNPNEDFKLKDAWAAGSLFYDVAQLPRFKRDENGNFRIQVDTDMPGAYALTEARKQLEDGKTLEQVRDSLYGNMGALALRAQLNDTLGHIGLDPLTWALGAVKPIERLHAFRNLALTGKMDVEYVKVLESEARLAGNIADADKFAEAITKASSEGKALTRMDKFAIALTGGKPWLSNVKEMGWWDKLGYKLNPFALNPQARASEMLDMVAANVGERLVVPNWTKDPEEFLKAVESASRGAIGDQFGHFATTIQGRTVQGVLSNSDAVTKVLGQEWTAYSKERSILSRLASLFPGTDERKIWKMAQSDPELLFEKITQAVPNSPDAQLFAKAMETGQLNPKTLEAIGKIDNSIPLMKEEFYAKALVGIQDVAMQQSILQFGIKEKGVLTKWSDALKAWESIPFIKANPANMMRNIVNNDVTLVGRGLFGTMTDAAIKDFWKGKYMPAQFERGFGFGIERNAEGIVEGFDPGNAYKKMEDVLNGAHHTADSVKEAAAKVNLGLFDFSSISGDFEKAASRRASTNGWIQFHQQYWNSRTGFTSISKHLDPAVLDEMEKIAPGLSRTLDEVAQSAGTDAEKFAKLMQTNVEHNFATILKNTSDGLGFKAEEVLGTDVLHTLQEGLPQAIETGNVRGFVESVRMQMEQHVDDMFNKHIENLPGIVAAQVQAGGGYQFHRIFGKAVDELWAGNTEHALRMSTINDLLSEAKDSKDWDRVSSLWSKIQSDGENHFGRVWKKFDAYQAGLEEGARQAGVKFPGEVRQSFREVKDGWQSFFEFRNKAYQDFFETRKAGGLQPRSLQELQTTIDTMFEKLTGKEDDMYRRIDDLMAGSLQDNVAKQMYMNFRDQVGKLREADRSYTKQFFKEVRDLPGEEAQAKWSEYWNERMTRVEQIRQLEARGSAAIQGDVESAKLFTGAINPGEGEPKSIYDLAHRYGISTATEGGTRNDKRILNTVNKYLPAGTEKYKSVSDIPLDIATQALEARGAEKAQTAVAGITKSFIPDADKIFKDAMPIETAISEMNYGRSYAVMDRLAEEAIAQSSQKSARLADLPEEMQQAVGKWMNQVNEDMSSFRSAGVQFAAFRRDSALLNYNRRTNFDSWIGHVAPFAFWTTHSMGNWMIHSADRPGMLSTYLRVRKLFETAGLKDQNVPTRLKNNIRVQLPFVPEWMGDTFVNPMRFLLPFDGFLQPWEQAQASKNQLEGKTKDTLSQMLEAGAISEKDYNDALNNQAGSAWDEAQKQASAGGDNYDAMDFVSMTMTPHAPLMWAYNAAKGTPNDIGAFTPMSRTVRNVATMMGVDDWSNSPYNVEGKVRKWMGLPAYDKWDDYRTAREISNMAADGKYSMESIDDAMMVASLVESGKMKSEDAVKQNKLYAEATKRANQEYAGGWTGTVLSALGIPVHAYPTGEQQQRELAKEFSAAYQEKQNGNVEAMTNFFNAHPEYESRLALFKSPEDRLKNFMVDHVWSRWNEMPKVNQDELKSQLGDKFANSFINKETRSYDSIDPLTMQVWLKLMGGKPVGSLTADQEVMTELAHLKFTDPETSWRVQTFYDMREQNYPNFYKLQNGYYSQNGKLARDRYLQKNPELKSYWDARKKWMSKNPDLVRFLTDDPKQLAKFAKASRNPAQAVPNAQEIKSQFSQPMLEILQDYRGGKQMPGSLQNYVDQLARMYNIPSRDLIGILTAQ